MKKPNFYSLFLWLILCLVFSPASFGASPEFEELPEKDYLNLVFERNEDLEALRKEIEAKLYSIRGELASQRPSWGITAEVDRWLNHSRGDRYADLAVSQRIDLGGRYGLQERDLLLGLRIMESRYANSVNEVLAKASSTYRQTVMAGFLRDMRE
ncbi:MAG TPA: TolC family protein, partial [Synergistaceae bacterium]|nr:TolC family protein [Synergistaceae bacterium]